MNPVEQAFNGNTDKITTFYREIADAIWAQLGPGHTEHIYHRAMELELKTRNMHYESRRPVLIRYLIEGSQWHVIGQEEIDIYDKDNNVIIELKSVAGSSNKFLNQIHKYHKQIRYEGLNPVMGIVINFPTSGDAVNMSTVPFTR